MSTTDSTSHMTAHHLRVPTHQHHQQWGMGSEGESALASLPSSGAVAGAEKEKMGDDGGRTREVKVEESHKEKKKKKKKKHKHCTGRI